MHDPRMIPESADESRRLPAGAGGDASVGADEGAQRLPGDAATRQLQFFAEAVSHDLRAPLRSIESFSALLDARACDVLDDTSRDYLARIRNAAGRMSSLLVAIGELSYAGRAELKPRPVDISLMADWVIAELQEADPERAAEVHVQPGLEAYGDERLLKLLLIQVLGNAWKFSADATQTRIDVTGNTDAAGRLQLTVRDAGSGFDMRYADKLFEPFQRLHGPEQGGGHGLGLAIALCIAERHHGHLAGESKPGQGSTFRIQLPATAAAWPTNGSP